MFTFAAPNDIKEIVAGCLFAVRWSVESEHELDQMAELLSDAEYLYEYFERYEKRLSYFHVSIDEAVRKTMREANQLIQELYDLSNHSRDFEKPDLDELFEPLHKPEAYGNSRYKSDYKAKGEQNTAPWVRIYAVRCDENFYVITGFGIKLVRQMKEDPLLENELNKLERATNYLREIGMI